LPLEVVAAPEAAFPAGETFLAGVDAAGNCGEGGLPAELETVLAEADAVVADRPGAKVA
jgi:hypothetical protein